MINLGTVLETARRAQGITQLELAELVGVKQPSIVRYEHNLREPESDVLDRIAAALGVTPEFLTHASRPQGAMAVEAHMRRKQTAKPTVWRQLEAKLNMTRWHAARLYEEVGLHSTLSIPRFDPDLYEPTTAARLLRTQWRMPLGPVVNLMAWVESAGILVLEDDFDTPRVDGMSQWAGDHPIIVLNAEVPVDRKRLTLAHELGHIVMHPDYASEDMEEQANTFAAELLMPAEIIKSDFRTLNVGKLVDLKRKWGVSMAALVERAHHLEMMTKPSRTSFYKMMSARGWRLHEPGSDELAPESPFLASQIGQQLIANGLGSGEVAKILGFDEPQKNYIIPMAAPRLHSV